MIVFVAESNTHVPVNMVGDRHGDAECNQGVCQSQWINIADACEAGRQKPAASQSDRDQHRIGPVGHAEEQSVDGNCLSWLQDAAELQKEKRLCNKLLNHGPGCISRRVSDGCSGPKKPVQSIRPPSADDDAGSQQHGCERNPPPGRQSPEAESEIAYMQGAVCQIGNKVSGNEYRGGKRPRSPSVRRAPQRAFKTAIHQADPCPDDDTGAV